jgi:pilus assembly protein HofM
MAFGNWRIGMDIQEDAIRAVAISRRRGAWYLQRWWRLPVDGENEGEKLSVALNGWHRQLPLGYCLCLGFPTRRTLQREIPAPPSGLSELQYSHYVASATGRQLQMSEQTLCLDFRPVPGEPRFAVTAARASEVDRLVASIRRARLKLTAIAPEACALFSFLPFIHDDDSDDACLVCRTATEWLWVRHTRWGSLPCQEVPDCVALCQRLSVTARHLVCCSPGVLTNDEVREFDPWRVLSRLQPPLPEEGERYAIALGLALARLPQ